MSEIPTSNIVGLYLFVQYCFYFQIWAMNFETYSITKTNSIKINRTEFAGEMQTDREHQEVYKSSKKLQIT